MIIIATMSIFSGVVSAKLYHQDKSRPVAPWIRRLTALISLRSASINLPTNHRDDRRTETVAETQHGASRTVDTSIYPVSNTVPSLNDEHNENKNPNENKPEDYDYHDYSAEWQNSAVAFDRFMFALSCVITISAIICTSILYTLWTIRLGTNTIDNTI